jgi:hypothetical protein
MSKSKNKHSRVKQDETQPQSQPEVNASDVIDILLAEAAAIALAQHGGAAMPVLNGRLTIAYNKAKREAS